MAEIHYRNTGRRRRHWLAHLTSAERWTIGSFAAAMLAAMLLSRFFPITGFIALFILGAVFKPLCYAALRRVARAEKDDES